EGQPMTIVLEVHKADDERITESTTTLVGTATKIGKHSVTITLAKGEHGKLDPLVEKGKAAGEKHTRPPVRVVDADRLIAWQLYWRGENFWSGDEIWGFLPEMKTAFVKTDNIEFTRYINDRTRAPLGRRYFLITEAGRITSARAGLPTQRARDSYEVIDTTSNKFSLAAFWLWPSEVVPADGLGHQRGLVGALALDHHAPRGLHAALDPLELGQREPGAHRRAGGHRRGEPQPVEPIVDPHRAAGDLEGRLGEHRQQRQREEAVRDRAAERRSPGALPVDVDPLEVPGGLGELVDPVLRDLDPGRHGDFLTDPALE